MQNQEKVSEPISFTSNTQEIRSLIERVVKFMPLTFPYQKKKHIAKFEFYDDVLTISDDESGTILPRGNGEIVSVYSGDNYTKKFHIF